MKGLQIPERFTGTLYISAYSDPTCFMYGLMSFDDRAPSDTSDRILVGTVEVDIPLDRIGSLDKQVEKLRKSKIKILAEATEKAGQIQDAIESLLAIEYQGEAK